MSSPNYSIPSFHKKKSFPKLNFTQHKYNPQNQKKLIITKKNLIQ